MIRTYKVLQPLDFESSTSTTEVKVVIYLFDR